MPNLATQCRSLDSSLTATSDYCFEGAHALVETSASVLAPELASNKFRFAADSVLEILRDRCQVTVLPS